MFSKSLVIKAEITYLRVYRISDRGDMGVCGGGRGHSRAGQRLETLDCLITNLSPEPCVYAVTNSRNEGSIHNICQEAQE